MVHDRLILFTRYPTVGETKTRLIPALGPTGAAELQNRMTRRVVERCRAFCAVSGAAFEVHFAGADEAAMSGWLGEGLSFIPQAEGGLGARMHCAFDRAFRSGARRAVIVGADCPFIESDHLAGAFAALRRHDVVFGPAEDGGYYLVGLSLPAPEIFASVPWGRNTVLRLSLDAARRAKRKVALVSKLPDIDRPEDLARWRYASLDSRPPPILSVVIPALNEENTLERAISSACDEAVEIIVADGGSRDRTREVARRNGAEVVRSRPGRGAQMNAGAAVAHADRLLFLHSDSLLPGGYLDEVVKTLGDRGVSAGAFSLRVDAPSFLLGVVGSGANLRSRFLQLPYGDQAIFCRAADFRRVGAYREVPVFEDVLLVRSLRRLGRIVTRASTVSTSARRWSRRGVLFGTATNAAAAVAGLFLGVSPDSIARLRCR